MWDLIPPGQTLLFLLSHWVLPAAWTEVRASQLEPMGVSGGRGCPHAGEAPTAPGGSPGSPAPLLTSLTLYPTAPFSLDFTPTGHPVANED